MFLSGKFVAALARAETRLCTRCPSSTRSDTRGRCGHQDVRWLCSINPEQCDACGDGDPSLSPINIDGGAAKLTEDCRPLVYQNYWHSEGNAFMINNGRTVEVSVQRKKYPPTLCGGPLPGPYIFNNLHFHWGPSDQQGSEHYVNGKRFAMEVHLVHFAARHKSLIKAFDYKKGVAVVSVFLKVEEFRKMLCDEYTPILNNCKDVIKKKLHVKYCPLREISDTLPR